MPKNYFIIKKLNNNSFSPVSGLFTSRIKAIRKFRNIIKNNIEDIYIILNYNTNEVIRITDNLINILPEEIIKNKILVNYFDILKVIKNDKSL